MGRKATYAFQLGRATLDSVRQRSALAEVEQFCFFIGYPRSGTTLIGSLLNAHPEIVLANELNVLRYLRFGVRRNQIFSLVLQREREFADGGYSWTDYEYAVPGQYQGRFEHLRVIGDKKAGRTTMRLRAQPELLDRLRTTVKVPIRVIHVMRNPFDTIATMARRKGSELPVAIDQYTRLAETVDQVRGRLHPGELFDLHYEVFIANPKRELARLCNFLDVSTPADYIEDCAAMVRPGGSRSRDGFTWSATERATVEALVASRPVLSGYTIDD